VAMLAVAHDSRVKQIRKCRKCGAAAVRVSNVTTHYVNGGYSGRTYDHQCQQCQYSFATKSLMRLVGQGFVASLFFLGGIGMIVSFITGLVPLYDDSLQGLALSYGLFGAMTIGGGIYGAILGRSVLNQMLNPVAGMAPSPSADT
jgi:hypothetical protein